MTQILAPAPVTDTPAVPDNPWTRRQLSFSAADSAARYWFSRPAAEARAVLEASR